MCVVIHEANQKERGIWTKTYNIYIYISIYYIWYSWFLIREANRKECKEIEIPCLNCAAWSFWGVRWSRTRGFQPWLRLLCCGDDNSSLAKEMKSGTFLVVLVVVHLGPLGKVFPKNQSTVSVVGNVHSWRLGQHFTVYSLYSSFGMAERACSVRLTCSFSSLLTWGVRQNTRDGWCWVTRK